MTPIVVVSATNAGGAVARGLVPEERGCAFWRELPMVHLVLT